MAEVQETFTLGVEVTVTRGVGHQPPSPRAVASVEERAVETISGWISGLNRDGTDMRVDRVRVIHPNLALVFEPGKRTFTDPPQGPPKESRHG